VAHVAGRLSLEFLRRKVSGNPGITYTPQFSNDLGAWGDFTGSPTSVTDIGDGSTWERVVIDDPVGGTTRFARVQVTKAP